MVQMHLEASANVWKNNTSFMHMKGETLTN